MKLRINLLYLFSLIILISISNYSRERVKIVTYNILNYPDNSSTKNPRFQRIMSAIDADIVIVEEILSQSAVNEFKVQVLGDDYVSGVFIDGPDTDSAIFYKDSLFSFISTGFISPSQGPRYIYVFKLSHNITQDTIIIYAAHFKASDGIDNETRRLNEAQTLRVFTDMLPAGTDYILVGDLNLYRSTEPAYEELLVQDGTGYFLDPLNEPGNWHNNSGFTDILTQSTRLTDIGDGGSFGGLDDRFDFILSSQSIIDKGGIDYVDGSYWAYGNDGNHFNQSIHDPPNDSVSTPIAIDLYLASDHLPVVAEFDFGVVSDVEDEQNLPKDFVLYQNYPNPFNPSTKIRFRILEFGFVSLKVYDVLGNEIATLVNEAKPAGSYEVEFSGIGLSTGVYFYRLTAADYSASKKLILLK